jgi:hypothetical protein
MFYLIYQFVAYLLILPCTKIVRTRPSQYFVIYYLQLTPYHKRIFLHTVSYDGTLWSAIDTQFLTVVIGTTDGMAWISGCLSWHNVPTQFHVIQQVTDSFTHTHTMIQYAYLLVTKQSMG